MDLREGERALPRHPALLLALASIASLALAPPATAQDRGLELSLDAPRQASPGRDWVAHGVVHQVRGLATLDPAPGALITVRTASESPTELTTTRAGADGSFVLRVPVRDQTSRTLEMELVVAHDGLERTLPHAIAIEPADGLALRTDRRFYRKGEPVHAWALLRDRLSLAPLADRPVQLTLLHPDGTRTTRTVRTDASGVAHHRFTLSAASAGIGTVVARRPDHRATSQVQIQVGQRTQERVLVELDWPEEHVAPSDPFHPEVRAISPSGAPARDAEVVLTVEGMAPIRGRTDAAGIWRGAATAPAYLANDSGAVNVDVVITHPAIGSARTRKVLRLSGSGGYRARAFTTGALAFGLPTTVFFALTDPAGNPAPAGVRFRVEAAPLPRGGIELTTDANGLAEATFRTAPLHAVADLCGPLGVPFEVALDRDRRHGQCLPAAPADLVVRAEEAVREPGQPLRVRLERSPAVARRPVAVSLVSPYTHEVLAVAVAGPTERELRFETPAALGALHIRAHARLDPDDAASAIGVVSETAVLVRPPAPSFIEVEAGAPSYEVGSTASVRVRTGATPGWLAVDVRDLAQHGGETPFRVEPLEGRFDRAVLDPDTPSAGRLVRSALAAGIGGPRAPSRALPERFGPGPDRELTERGEYGLVSDPILAARLAARQAGAAGMRMVERALRERGAEALTTGERARRRFDPVAVDEYLAEQGELRALGDRPLRLGYLKEADARFGFPLAARRLARERLIRALHRLVQGIDANRIDGGRPERWVSEMVRHGTLHPRDLRDPWGGPLGVRARPSGVIAPSPEASDWTLAFPGPDGRLGTADDMVDPFARVVPEGTLYAEASGEEQLLRSLSMLVPVEATLAGWALALRRVTEAMEATLRGDAVSAEAIGESFAFGGLGLQGSGSGGGGYGSGYGRGRGARVPRIRTGRAAVADPLAELSGRVRQDFPGTLLFVPAAPTSDDGSTEIPIPLADAATTYLVEVVHWRADGWAHSASTRFSTEKPLLVEAPLPPVAHVGEVLRIPMRARSRAAMDVSVAVVAEGDALVRVGEPQALHVQAGGAAVGYVEVEVVRAGRGSLVAVARGDGHDDAIRLPFQAIRDVRRIRRVDDRLLFGDRPLIFGATDRERDVWAMAPSTITLSSAGALFGGDDPDGWRAWAAAMDGEHPTMALARTEESPLLAVAIHWGDDRLSDEQARAALEAASRSLENEDALRHAYDLLALAPAWKRRDARAELREDLERLRDALLAAVEKDATEASERPGLHALAAAALATHGETGLAGEMARRARRSLVRFGDELWLPTGGGPWTSRGASAALGLADVELGEPQEAFQLLRTIADRRHQEPARHAGLRWLDQSLAAAMAARLAGAPLEAVAVTLAGREHQLPLRGGRATFQAKLRRGRGAVPIELPEGQLLVARITSELGMAWPATTERGGPLRVRVDPGSPALDRTTEATIEVRNAVPRSIREPELTITLPAGAVLDERARARLNGFLIEPVTVEAGRLRARLRPLLPGTSVELPIGLRYEVAGELSGFGVDAFARDREDRRTVVPPRTLTITTDGASTSGDDR